jgi:hypothetical protein
VLIQWERVLVRMEEVAFVGSSAVAAAVDVWDLPGGSLGFS